LIEGHEILLEIFSKSPQELRLSVSSHSATGSSITHSSLTSALSHLGMPANSATVTTMLSCMCSYALPNICGPQILACQSSGRLQDTWQGDENTHASTHTTQLCCVEAQLFGSANSVLEAAPVTDCRAKADEERDDHVGVGECGGEVLRAEPCHAPAFDADGWCTRSVAQTHASRHIHFSVFSDFMHHEFMKDI
jgi:hypothetical protein